MIAAKMNTTPTLVFNFENPKLKIRKKVKIMCENYCLDLDSMPKVLQTLDGVTLSEMDLPPIKYVIKDLLPQGLAMLNGSMKIGKSWMVLDWCVRIAKGENIWNFPTTKGTTLYLSLEDSNTRLQDRLLSVTEEVPPNVYFSIRCLTIGNGLEEQIRNFVADHPDTVLVAIDIFQKIRTTTEINYGVDYSEIEILKSLAGELGIAILLVHHVRKKEDDDPFNMPSGSNGLAGCADTLFVLKKSKRCSADATLFCTGRDIEYREIDVRFEKEYGFSVVVPKSKTVKGMSTAEYHVAEKGQSWKLDLAMAIDEAMRYAVSKEHFIELMEMEGYEVKWKDTHKYITYTCPNGKPCRDIRLHEEKYLKENMEDEFRIRKEIIARAEGSGTEKSGRGKADDELRFRIGEVMDGADSAATDTNQYARFDSGIAENVGDMERPIGYAGGAVEGADGSRRADGTDPDGVSGDTSSTGGSDSDSDLDFNGELPITGWESERELLTATLIGGTNGEAEFEEADFGFAYPDYPADHLGIDSAYLAGDVMNILDNDSHTEDCTTMNQPPHNKKNTQSGGFKMSM